MTHRSVLFLSFGQIQDHFSELPSLHYPSHLALPRVCLFISKGPSPSVRAPLPHRPPYLPTVYGFSNSSGSYLLFPSLPCDGPHPGSDSPSDCPHRDLGAVPLLPSHLRPEEANASA